MMQHHHDHNHYHCLGRCALVSAVAIFTVLLLWSTVVNAAVCPALVDVKLNDTAAKTQAIQQCILQGYDPPISLRPAAGRGSGIDAGTAGGGIGNTTCPPYGPCEASVPK